MNRKIKLRAFAKANLSLNITGKNEQNGLHEIDSVMMSLDKFDTVTVTERNDSKINVKFINADIGENNTALKAALKVKDKIDCGLDIEIEKGIPIGAGLGGSSADAAAVLRALDVLYRLPERGVDMRNVALSVGSDVPFMLTGGLARVRGTGEEMFFIENKLQLFIVGLMTDSVSTAQAYADFDRLYTAGNYCPTDNDRLCNALLGGETQAVELLDNALYRPAVLQSPAIERNKKLLTDCGASACMTGSGGMVLGYFTDMEKFVACAHKLRNSDVCVFAPAKTGVLHEWMDK